MTDLTGHLSTDGSAADEPTSDEPLDGETLDVTGDIDLSDLGAPTLAAALEALLLVTDEPVAPVDLATTVRRPVVDVLETLRGLARTYDEDGRGFELREVGGGWRFYTRDTCSEVVERYVRDGQQARLTGAALETLAVVAYRQPVTRARVSAVRGVNVDGVVRTLLARGLVTEVGTEESGALLYGTTSYFLERLGISDLSELPPLADHLPALGDLDDLAGELAGGVDR